MHRDEQKVLHCCTPPLRLHAGRRVRNAMAGGAGTAEPCNPGQLHRKLFADTPYLPSVHDNLSPFLDRLRPAAPAPLSSAGLPLLARLCPGLGYRCHLVSRSTKPISICARIKSALKLSHARVGIVRIHTSIRNHDLNTIHEEHLKCDTSL
ncbi:hypothetical protein BDU57DRAFT_259822 [Ampelomyces quisqualis]|uniref:Uncharacterized protein n=1 Tax=Ampelomyces quisqualis TaxID=50730 RepID=A0A6A5QGY8_AMPQU|nr:hypothetical protein BDU57DRAFT_259822 [Ampelomyces quisqualis]